MENKVKKILATTLLSAVSATAIGCTSGNSKLAKNIDKSMAEFVSSINNLDYVDTSMPDNSQTEKVGKIVQTATTIETKEKNNDMKYFNDKISDIAIENTITRPSERSDNFKLFVLSESPYITFSSNDNTESINFNIKFSTNKIEETSDEINSKINSLILKRSILMIYVNEIYNGNVNLSEENKVAINAYVNVIKENTSFFKGNRGMVKNQLKLASDLVSNETNENLINYYIIKSGEALETRASKIDSSISAIDSIIKIIEANLSPSSSYYNSNLSITYDKLLSNLNKPTNISSQEITKDSTNKEIADSIADSLNFLGTQEIKTNPAENTALNNNTQTATNNNENNTDKTQQSTTNNQVESNQNLNNTNVTPTPFPNNINSSNNPTNGNQNIYINQPNVLNNTNPADNNSTSQNNQLNRASTGFQPNTNNNLTNENQEINNSQTTNRINRRRRLRRRNNINNSNNLRTNLIQNENNQNPNNNLNNPNSNQNIENNNPTTSTNSNRPNSAKSVTNMIEQKENDDKFLRADRTRENSTKEEFTPTQTVGPRRITTNEANRMPYREDATF